jgi:peptidoglycan/LPS O-acetylase OafA/YrhL
MIALFFGGLLIFAHFTPADKGIGKILSSKPLRFFGKYSYALYVFHHLVSIYLPMYGFSVESIPAIKGSHLPGYFGFCLVATMLSIGLAVASWHLWELRFLKLKIHYEYDRIALQPADANYPIKTQA